MLSGLVDVAWDYALPRHELTVSLEGPATLLQAFDTPGLMMSQFVAALEGQGLGAMTTNSMRAQIANGRFALTWSGVPAPTVDSAQVDLVVGEVVRALA
jgi:predicted nuclease of restriction endonuclease-like RecB superfamily